MRTAGKWKGAIDVAVKTMKPGTMSAEKFLEEAEVMKTLRHRRLVTLYAVCTQDEPIYIVTELMSGGSLLALLRRHSKNKQSIAIDVLIDMAAQVCPGPDLAGGRPGAQPNYGSISVTGASLGAHKTRGSRP